MSTQASRIITLYATKGGKKAKLDTAVTTWKELKDLARKEGYDVDKLLSTENVTRHDLVNDEALLPEGAFTLFMRPKQVKSGNRGDGLSYKEIKATIKSDMEANEEAAKAHYNQEKNYTTKGTEELRSLVSSYVAPSDSKPTGQIKEAKIAETATEVIEEKVVVVTNLDRINQVAVLLGQIILNASSEDVKDRASEIVEDYLPGLQSEIEADTNASTTTVADVVESVKESKESAEEEGRRVAREKAEKEEAEKIAAEKAAKAEADRLEKEEDERLAAEAKKFS